MINLRTVLVEGIRGLRPAPLASAIAQISGLDKRRFVHSEHGNFYVNPVSNLGSRLLRGEYEPSTTALLSEYLKPGAVFVDLGANEGYFTVIASRLVGPEGIVIAIEPQTRLQEVLRMNLNANHCQNVRLVKAVVSSKTGRAQLALTPDMNTGATSLFRSTKYPLPTEEVQSFTLAELFTTLQIHRCDLMKVDIEGAEYDALMGAREVLARGVMRHIAVEVHYSILKQRGLSWDRADQLISECGYRSANTHDPRVYSFG